MTRIDRLMAEVLLLQDRPRGCDEISRLLEVSRRTVIRDVQALCEMGVPVISRDGVGGGYSLASHYTISPLELSWREAFLLLMAVDGLVKMSDSPFSAERASLVAKLRATIPDKHLERVTAMREWIALQVPEQKGRAPMLDLLVEIVGSGAWISIRYDAATGLEERLVRPDKLYADRGLWYLTAVGTDGSRTLRVDRIVNLVPADAPLDVKEEAPYDDPSHPLIRVALTRRGARVVQRDPHLGPHVDPTLDRQELEFRCPPTELDWYASYFGNLGADALVESPTELRTKIAERARSTARLYS